MKRLHLALVFASGCATAAMAGWFTTVRAQVPGDPNVVHVCAAPEGVLKVTPLRSLCPAGQQSMFFRRSAEPPPTQAPDESPKDTADARIKALERRIAELEGQASRTGLTRRVPAPFEVVDRNGKRVFYVSEDREATLSTPAGDAVVRFGARNTGGFILTSNAARSLRTNIFAGESDSALEISEGQGNVRARLGTSVSEPANYRMTFTSKDGKQVVASIGEFGPGVGAAVVVDPATRASAEMSVEQGRGEVRAVNGGGISVATLSEGKTAGGLFVLTSSTGERMVAAGVQPGGFGVVQAGPASFMQAAGLGLPGSYIAGKP